VDAAVNNAHGDLRNILHNEYIYRYRRDNNADHYGDAYHHAEPEGVIPELHNRWKEYRGGENHEGQVVNEGSSEEIDESDEKHDNCAVDGQLDDPVGYQHRYFCDR